MQHIRAPCGEVMYFGCFCFMGELGFLNCDDICMSVMNKQFDFNSSMFHSSKLHIYFFYHTACNVFVYHLFI